MASTAAITPAEDMIAGPNGLRILVRSWRPVTPAKAVVAIVHGVNSHSGYYKWVATQLTAHGFAVYAVDLHGRGKSDGERFYLESIRDYLADELVRADERLKEEFPLITIPLLILHGTADKVTNPKGSQFFYETAGSADKTLKLYDGHVHDLLNDLGREAVMADIVHWVTARL